MNDIETTADFSALCRPDGTLLLNQKDFLRWEAIMLGLTVLSFGLLCVPLYNLGFFTTNLQSALLMLLCGLFHWAGGMIVTDKLCNRAADLVMKRLPGTERFERALVLRQSVAFKGCYMPLKFKKALINNNLYHEDDPFFAALDKELLKLEQLRSRYWLALPCILLVPAVLLTNL